jgi:predicted CXXCH cytochrome family protein
VRAAVRATALAALLLPALGLAATPLRPPRAASDITRALALGPHAGLCEECHSEHAASSVGVYPNALIGPDDNTLCLRCHDTPWAGGSFADHPLYLATAHGSSTSMIWPGPVPPPRIEPDAIGKCLNCHDPHGWTDVSGEIPMLRLAREENLCLTCHDGSPAVTNLQAEFQKPYRHPTTLYAGRHSGPVESAPTDFGTTPLNQRHAECEDCHNPHVDRPDRGFPPIGNDASLTTLGVSRVAVLNGAAGSPPAYTFLAGSDTLTAPFAEYQLCFKCHSSWTTQPTGQTDMARVLNPNNPSFHPVEATGRNTDIALLSFTTGWGSASITRCGDCHGAESGSVRGPHGSSYPAILRADSPAAPDLRSMAPDELCFSCHSYDVYANPAAAGPTRAWSRFNGPGAVQGHAEHVGGQNVPCYACHVTHGSTTQPFLIVTGRSPGIISFNSNAGGGTCTPSCHGTESYTVNYAR